MGPAAAWGRRRRGRGGGGFRGLLRAFEEKRETCGLWLTKVVPYTTPSS